MTLSHDEGNLSKKGTKANYLVLLTIPNCENPNVQKLNHSNNWNNENGTKSKEVKSKRNTFFRTWNVRGLF